MSNSSAGLADSAKRSRIKRKAVRPPVAGRPVLGAQPLQPEPQSPQVGAIPATTPTATPAPAPAATTTTTAPEPLRTKEPVLAQPLSTSEPSEVTPYQATSERSEATLERAMKEAPLVEAGKGSRKKKKAQQKKISHTQPRFEVRLSGDHEALVGEVQRKAFKEAHIANKGINNSELFGGFLEAIRPFRKNISFSSLDFKRGKLYGDGTEKIKVEVGKSVQRSALEYFLSAIQEGEDEVVGEVLQALSKEQRKLLASKLLTPFEEMKEDEPLVANS